MEGSSEDARYLTAREAAGKLGVSLPTLYAYVSRELVRSEAAGGRGRRYRAEDVRRLVERKERRRDPERAAEGVLSWGTPVMESAITLITEDGIYYRGQDAVALARGSSFERVAALLWTGDPDGADELFGGPMPDGLPMGSRGLGVELPPVGRLQALLPVAGAGDAAAYDLRPSAVARAGVRILRLSFAAVVGPEVDFGRDGLARALQQGWAPGDERAADLLEAALILCADHELNVSAFTARCVASSGATPYDVVTAALSAMRGTRHGGVLELVEKLLQEAENAGDAREVLAARMRRGEGVPGFGHHLYPGGDPRGRELLRLVAEAYPRSAAVEVAGALVEAAEELIGGRPTVDLGLATLARAIGAPAGGALAVFALGRTAGWVAHAIEQYDGGALIRPRARYVGELPGRGP